MDRDHRSFEAKYSRGDNARQHLEPTVRHRPSRQASRERHADSEKRHTDFGKRHVSVMSTSQLHGVGMATRDCWAYSQVAWLHRSSWSVPVASSAPGSRAPSRSSSHKASAHQREGEPEECRPEETRGGVLQRIDEPVQQLRCVVRPVQLEHWHASVGASVRKTRRVKSPQAFRWSAGSNRSAGQRHAAA